jgi:hypothetical protein
MVFAPAVDYDRSMLSPLDDYPIHQAPRPIAVPATTDRNHYGRYWFGAFHRQAGFSVEAAFGRYTNLGVADASLSIVKDDHQYAFHASGHAPEDPMVTSMGPFRLEIVEPMKELRITVEENDTDLTADLTWKARTGALAEDHTYMDAGPVRVLDMIRFTQFGTWAGEVTVRDETTTFTHDEMVGVRDRSWGIRPVGERPAGRAFHSPGNCWLWAPIHFDDECRLFGYFQEPGGKFWRADGFRVPVLDPVPASVDEATPGVFRLEPVGQRLEFRDGTRWVERAEFDLEPEEGEPYTIVLEPKLRFQMKALGYTNPSWGHGHYHGELEVGAEEWDLSTLEPADPTVQHVHHTVEATMRTGAGETKGIGLFEQIIFGPHTQFGFHDLLDA